MIMTKRTMVHNAIDGWLGGRFDQLQIIGTYNLLGNAATMVQQKAGIALGIRRNCVFDDVRFVPLSPKLATKTVLVWKKHQAVSPLVSAFVQFAKAYILRMTGDSI